jgi:hypothetical protein
MSDMKQNLDMIPRWDEKWDMLPGVPKERHMEDEIEALRSRLQEVLQQQALSRPDISKLQRYNGQFIKVDEVEALLDGRYSVPAPQPKLVLSLPSHEDRRLIIVRDEMINGERHLGLAIKPPIGAR